MEQKGIATERGNLNRQIAEDNKNLRATRARITRLMKWQREEKARPLDLSQAGFKASVMDKLQSNKEVLKYQNQKIEKIKNQGKVLSFLQTYDINSIEEFSQKIVGMNESFYALKREINSTEKAISSIDRKISLWEEYAKVKPMIEKYNALTDKKKRAAYEKYKGKIDSALELKKIWSDFQKDGGHFVKNDLYFQDVMDAAKEHQNADDFFNQSLADNSYSI